MIWIHPKNRDGILKPLPVIEAPPAKSPPTAAEIEARLLRHREAGVALGDVDTAFLDLIWEVRRLERRVEGLEAELHSIQESKA